MSNATAHLDRARRVSSVDVPAAIALLRGFLQRRNPYLTAVDPEIRDMAELLVRLAIDVSTEAAPAGWAAYLHRATLSLAYGVMLPGAGADGEAFLRSYVKLRLDDCELREVGGSAEENPGAPRRACDVERDGSVSGLRFHGAVLASGERGGGLLSDAAAAGPASGDESSGVGRCGACRCSGSAGWLAVHRDGPRPGDVFYVGPAASVQFAGDRALVLRVIRVDPRPTYVGWRWIDGYVLGPDGSAIERRSVFVQVAGLLPLPDGTDALSGPLSAGPGEDGAGGDDRPGE
ncbi:hypothetical protein GCM10010112_92900 [Actinoplanes lobatus]|uniref:Uncharacterized protein n=1 Tax=Actinoplanes lobatus TaxID=113568 RepID=A0A7W7HR60_9ACTN|nr:hypothetical protein [Actinoplanes lobatus]GGN99251.1 hypothetical protein GCM10010112_92900 [Actinoplanes lobatus]GIE40561.1 hypothetical protein Alo02nite_34590 [Actinoplanes lobatus]